MLNLKLFLIVILQSIIFLWAGSAQDKRINGKSIKVVRVGPCLRTNLPCLHLIQFGKSNLRKVVINNITVVTREDLKDQLKFTASIKRCASRENLDSCEDYFKLRHVDYCQAITPGLINPFTVPFHPEMRCPIKKGLYQAFNFTFNFGPFLMFNIDGWYWRAKAEIISPTENNRPIACIDIELYTKF